MVALRQWAEREGQHRKAGPPAGVPFHRRNLFRLARQLRGLDADPEELVLSDDGRGVCGRLAVNPEDLSAAFGWATANAGRFAGPGLTRPYFPVLAALSCRLTERAGPTGYAPFPSGRLAALLDLHRDTVDTAVGRLEAAGVVRVLRTADGRTKFSRCRGEARMVRYVGPPPVPSPEPTAGGHPPADPRESSPVEGERSW